MLLKQKGKSMKVSDEEYSNEWSAGSGIVSSHGLAGHSENGTEVPRSPTFCRSSTQLQTVLEHRTTPAVEVKMPLCTIQLVALNGNLEDFVKQLKDQEQRPLVLAKVIRWIITPSTLSVDRLLKQKWDILVIYNGTSGLPEKLCASATGIFTVQAGVPSTIVNNFAATNERLLHPEHVPALTGSLDRPRVAESAQNLEFTSELNSWLQKWDPDGSKGAVSMLNFLAFKPGMHDEYLKYGKAFSESIGARRGGIAKVVGRVTGEDEGVALGEAGWDELALAHYPSIRHFADMAASEDYQEVNHKHRIPSLRDTCILCTSELEIPGSRVSHAKL